MFNKLIKGINEKRRYKKLSNEIEYFKEKSFSIISSDCIGGILYHDIGKQFLSPTINLSIFDNTFLTFCENLKFFLNKELEFVETKKPHPVALLKNNKTDEVVKINFVHYKTREEAAKSWAARKQRIDFNNLFFIYNIESIDKETISRIDKLINSGLRFFVICKENQTNITRDYIHISKYLSKTKPKKAGKLLSFKFLSGKRNFDDLKIYKYLMENIK